MSMQSVVKPAHKPTDKSAAIIDGRAIIDPSAIIGEGVKVGPWSIIGPDVEIGAGTEIGAHVVISCNTTIGNNNKIYPYVSLGGDPQDLHYKGEETFLKVGDNNIIREFVTINRGSAGGRGTTTVGNKNCFLAYSHVAHDCIIGNEVLFVNSATIAGHVTIDDHAIIGAFCAVHQFCRVGAYSFITQGAMVGQDILPYMLVVGSAPCGLNTIGLKRHGFSDATLSALKRAFHIIFRRGLKLKEIREELIKMQSEFSEIDLILELMDSSTRGFAR